MPYSKAKATYYRNIAPALVAIFVALAGIALAYIDSIEEAKAVSKNKNTLIISRINDILEVAEKGASNFTDKLGAECNQVYSSLRDQLYYAPTLRALSLADKKGQIYCSTSLDNDGKKYEVAFLKGYSKESLFLNKESPRIPNVPAIHYVSRTDNGSVIASIDAKNLVLLISPENERLAFSIKIGNTYLNGDGHLNKISFNNLNYVSEQKSVRYPFSVTTGYTQKLTLKEIIKNKTTHIILTSILAIVIGLLTKLTLKSLLSPMFELRQALRQGEIVPYVQVIVRSDTEQVIGLEILARWNHPKDGIIPPDFFIPLAEQTGFIKTISKELMRKTARAIMPYRYRLPEDFHFAFNIAPIQFEDNEILEDCKEFIDTLMPAHFSFALEITERELVNINKQSMSLFEQLHALDVKIALDDFGIGHSSLSYLNDLKIDLLKIDKAFVSKIQGDKNSQSVILLDTIIDLSQKIGIGTVAEGVENRYQVEYLQEKNVFIFKVIIMANLFHLRIF